MKRIFFLITLALTLISCQTSPDLTLFNANKEIAQKYLGAYESPSNLDLLLSLTSEDIKHQSPMYGAGEVGYKEVVAQANFYMGGFTNVKFIDAVWLPGVNNETLLADGSVRVYGTWTGESVASGKSFSVNSYHYFEVKEGKIIQSGDFFDATGMIMAVATDQEAGDAAE